MIEVSIIESERGWGQKVDETKLFKTVELADAFVEEYNKRNNEDTVPDYYTFAKVTNYRAVDKRKKK